MDGSGGRCSSTSPNGDHMTSTLSTLIAQFTALAPRSLRHAGTTYTLSVSPSTPILVDEARGEAMFAYLARKAPGAFLRSKIGVTVRYDAGADLYDLLVLHADGATFETSEIASVEGWFAEDFERLADLLAISAHERVLDLAVTA